MLKFFNKKPQSYHAPEGQRLYAIGDVHGCYDQMIALLNHIEADHAAREEKDCIIVFLGDLIDRGPDSKAVLDYITQTPPRFASVHCLMGNHEEMFLTILNDDADMIPRWLVYGGESYIKSYGLVSDTFKQYSVDTMQHMIKKYVPKSHVEFLKTLPDSFVFGDYVLVHAGVNPKLPLEQQTSRDFRWMREPFLSWKKNLDFKVVHGHTIQPNVTLLGHRIGTDTGAYSSGILSAVRLEETEIGVLNSDGLNETLNPQETP